MYNNCARAENSCSQGDAMRCDYTSCWTVLRCCRAISYQVHNETKTHKTSEVNNNIFRIIEINQTYCCN